MRKTISTIALIAGLVCLLIGIGTMTWWSPDERLSAKVPAKTQDAPITVISSEIHVFPDAHPKLTLGESGEYTVVVARPWDIKEWVGKSTVNQIESFDQKAQRFEVKHQGGEKTAPNPKGSDLWIQESTQSGDWNVEWPQDVQGPVSIMVMKDGKEAAPTDLTLAWDNPDAEASAKWAKATPWFVAAVVLVGLGLIILMSSSRRPRGRRAAGGAAQRADTGANVTVGGDSAETGADVAAGSATASGIAHVDEPDESQDEEANEGGQNRSQAYEDENSVDDDDALPNVGGSAPYTPQEDDTILSSGNYGVVAPEHGEDSGDEGSNGGPEADSQSDERRDDDDDDEQHPGSSGGGPAQDGAEGSSLERPDKDAEDDRGEEGRQNMNTPPQQSERHGRFRRSPRARWISALAVVGLVLPAGPAWADDASPTPSESAQEESQDDSEDTYPVVVSSQLNRIMKQVSEASGGADKAQDAKKLDQRFTAEAKSLRSSFYDARKKKVKLAKEMVPSIPSEVVTAAASTDLDYPRTVMAVTRESSDTMPVVVTLQQKNARSQYQVVSSVPMVEKATFPGIAAGDPDVKTADPKSSAGVSMSPEESLEEFAKGLSDKKSASAKKFASSPMVDQWRKANESTKKTYESGGNGTFTSKVKAKKDSARALSLPDGSVMVSGTLTETITMKPKEEGGKSTLAGYIKEFVGKKETDRPVEATLSIPVVLNIKDGKTSNVVGMSYVPVNAKTK